MPQPQTAATRPTVQDLRGQMPICEKWAYLDHAAVAPISGPASEAIRLWNQQAAQEGVAAWSGWMGQLRETRRLGAQVTGANEDEITLVSSTTAGINLVAEGIDWREGDNVVTLADEFPSNLYPWMQLERLGVELRRVPTDRGAVDYHELASACDRRTRVVTVSWVGYSNGVRRDLTRIGEVARKYDSFFFVDAIQGLGVYPIHVGELGIDGLAADGHKWMLGPEGAGIAYIRSEWLDRLRPLGVGWNSVTHAGDYANLELNLKPSAARYEGGSHNMVGFVALGASLRLLNEIGTPSLEHKILENAGCVRALLTQHGGVVYSPEAGAEVSGIVSCRFSGVDLKKLKRLCLEDGVVINFRDGRLRVSPHAYTDERDFEKLDASLATALPLASE
ncbi:MAG: aminotransferase class V-fold PLP-dependent enzyme [Planctomycetota bacterium]